MTDRVIVYNTAIPQTTDMLKASKFAMLGDAYLALATLGSDASSPATVVAGLACTPTGPASLQVNLGPGAIFTLDATDTSGYGDLGTDSVQVYKMGVRPQTGTLTITPPATIGYSQVFLVQAILSNIDGGSAVLSYYNSSNPAIPYSGPSNSGTSQFTTRTNVCTIALKAGVAATTGTQVTPTPDAGYTALYAITVANGQTQITSNHIVAVNDGYAPFINTALPYIPTASQSGKWIYGVDTGTLNALVVSITPALTVYAAGLTLRVKAANSNTGATTINVNGLGLKSVVRRDGTILRDSDIISGAVQEYVYDGTSFQLQSAFGRVALVRNVDLYVNGAVGNDTNDGTANTSGKALATIQKAVDIAFSYPPSQFTITIHVADGTYVGAVSTPTYGGPNIVIDGNSTTPANVVASNTTSGAHCFSVQGPNTVTVKNLKVQNSGAGNGGGFVASNGGMLTTMNTVNGAIASGPVWEGFGGGQIIIAGNHVHAGGFATGIMAIFGGQVQIASSLSITISTPVTAGTSYAYSTSHGGIFLNAPNTVWSGSTVTGTRYLAGLNSVISVNGGGVNVFPGTVAGSTASGGQYA